MSKKPHEPHDPTDMSHPLYDSAKDPKSPFYEGNAVDEHRSDASTDDGYKVGPGFPPKQYKWKKGRPSPNPKGRPRKVPSMIPDLKKAFESALNEKVVITKDKKTIVLTKAALGIQQLVNQFAKGDRYARRDVFEYAALLGIDLQAKEAIQEALAINDQAIVDEFLRRQRPPSGVAAADVRVKALSDLVDDDVARPGDPADAVRPAVAPTTKTEPNSVPPGGHTPLSIQAERERNIARHNRNNGS